MVPLDEETLTLIARITEIRSHGSPLPHPRYRRPAQFLFTYLGRRLTQQGIRRELAHAAQRAGLEHITSHKLRHTCATALVNAGLSLQALMALLGYASVEMSLRYGRLFDATVRGEHPVAGSRDVHRGVVTDRHRVHPPEIRISEVHAAREFALQRGPAVDKEYRLRTTPSHHRFRPRPGGSSPRCLPLIGAYHAGARGSGRSWPDPLPTTPCARRAWSRCHPVTFVTMSKILVLSFFEARSYAAAYFLVTSTRAAIEILSSPIPHHRPGPPGRKSLRGKTI